MFGGSSNRSLGQLLIVTLLLLVIPLGLISLVALEGYERHLVPELRGKAEAVGRSLGRRIERALSLGIPLERLVGMDAFFGPLIEGNADIAFIALADESGKPVYASGVSLGAAARVINWEAQEAAAGTAGIISRLRTEMGNLIEQVVPEEAASANREQMIRAGFLVTAVPVLEGDADRPVATLYLGVPLDFLTDQFEDIAFDILIVLLVGLLVAFELLLLVVSTNLTHPIGAIRDVLQQVRLGRFPALVSRSGRGEVSGLTQALAAVLARVNNWRSGETRPNGNRAGNLAPLAGGREPGNAGPLAPLAGGPLQASPVVAPERENVIVVRILAFLFVAAEELTRPFLPVYIERYASAVTYGDPAMLTGLPLSLFMLMAALALSFGGPISRRVGRRRVFAIGALLATLGLIGTAFAPSYEALILWRLVSGAGYGLAFVACQGYILDHTGPGERARGVATFVGGIMSADICGPAIGGVLADRIGFEATILVGAGIALFAALSVGRLMNEKRTRGVPASPDQRRIRAGFAAIASNWRFWIIVVFAALPAKLLLTGFLFFQVPLFLTDLGSSQSEIGRIVMLYGIVALVAVPVCAHWADRLDAHGFAVGLGGLLAGGALLLILSELPPSLVIIIAVAVFGLGQALTLSSLIAVVTRVATHDLSGPRLDSALAAYRLVERLGAAAGPVLAAFLVTRYGHDVAMALTGAIGFITCLIFSVLMMTGGYAPEPEIRTGDFQIADRP